MKLEKYMVGAFVRTRWDCVGARDGILVDVDDGGKCGRFLGLRGSHTESISCDQVIKVGSFMTSANSGL